MKTGTSRYQHYLASSLIALGAFAFLALLLGLLLTQSPSAQAADQPPERHIVVLKSGVNPQDIARDHGLQPQHVYRYALSGFSAAVPAGRLAALQRDPRVAYVEADQPVQIFAQTLPTGIQRIFASKNSAIDIDGSDDYRVDVGVAVIDTGIDFDHPDLNVVFRTNCAQGGPFNQNCTDGDGDDGNGHGTHVAGTIAAIDNGDGVVGVAPGARLYAIKVLKDDGSGWYSWIIAGVDKVTAKSAEVGVANMSLGGGSSTALCDAISNSVAKGVVYAVAAGNSDADAKNYSPANCADVITVSALADFDGVPGGLVGTSASPPFCRVDQDDTLADFSNWGTKVDVTAPGVCIRSTWNGGGYNTISGTSMASPHVAGAAALLASMSKPTNKTQALAVRQKIINHGNFNWIDDSGDGIKEPLLDVSNSTVFNPKLVAGSSGGGSTNTPPTADNVSTTTNEDTAVVIALSGSDAETCELTFSIVTGPSNGSLSVITNNACSGTGPYTDSASVTYTPHANFNGSDSFTYKVNDDSADSSPATVSVTVNAVNDAPVAQDKSASTQKDTAAAVTLTASDIDNCELNFSIVAGPSNGTLGGIINNVCVSGSPNTDSASVTYTPNSGFTGSDSFTYKVNDGGLDSNTATVSIAVTDQATTVHVGDLDGSSTNQGSTWTAMVVITIHDSNQNAVHGANVSGTFSWNGNSVNRSCNTNSSGQCSVQVSGIPKRYSPVTFTVTGVSGTLTYDPDNNTETSILVNK